MRTLRTNYEANVWHRMFAFTPKPVYQVETDKGGSRNISVSYHFFCFVERKFNVVKGVFTGVEYRTYVKNPHRNCVHNCMQPGCEAPIRLDSKLRRRAPNVVASFHSTCRFNCGATDCTAPHRMTAG